MFWYEYKESVKGTLSNGRKIKMVVFPYGFGTIKKEGKRENYCVFNVTLAAGKTKEINNWLEEKPSPLNQLPTYKDTGVEALIWAKNTLEQIIIKMKAEHFNEKIAIMVVGADKKRARVYEKFLTKKGFIKTNVVFSELLNDCPREEGEGLILLL